MCCLRWALLSRILASLQHSWSSPALTLQLPELLYRTGLTASLALKPCLHVQVYVVPYLMVNAWLVMITQLQHTHPSLPHYTADGWDWLRGALATCDRSFGFLDTFHHHIADTHVLHHLFSTIPHYHAQVGQCPESLPA